MKIKPILTFIASLVFITCNSEKNESEISSKNTESKSNILPVKSEESTAENFYNDFYIINKRDFKNIPIDSLILNFDSIQFRIWYISELTGYRELFIFQKTKVGWNGYRCKMQLEFSTDTPSLKELNGPRPQKLIEVKEVNPKHGWNNFIDSLQKLKIMSLPDMDSIPGLVDNWDDGYTYYFEVATKENFRFYRYHMADVFVEKYWQAENVEKIRSLLFHEFKK